MKEILTETLRKSGAAVCDKIKAMFLNGECDHLTANDLETWTQLANPAKYYTGEEAVSYLSGMSEREIYMRILNAKSRESRAKERRGV